MTDIQDIHHLGDNNIYCLEGLDALYLLNYEQPSPTCEPTNGAQIGVSSGLKETTEKGPYRSSEPEYHCSLSYLLRGIPRAKHVVNAWIKAGSCKKVSVWTQIQALDRAYSKIPTRNRRA